MSKPFIIFTDVNARQGGFLRRAFLFGGFTSMGLGALAIRLADLQIVEADRYRDLASANQWNFRLIPPPRGRILDRSGVVLADNRPSFRLLVVRDETSGPRRHAELCRQADPRHRLAQAPADQGDQREPRFRAGGGRHRPDLGGVRQGQPARGRAAGGGVRHERGALLPLPGRLRPRHRLCGEGLRPGRRRLQDRPQRRDRPDAAEPRLPDRQAGRGEGARRRAHRQARRAQGRSRRARPGGGRGPRRRPRAGPRRRGRADAGRRRAEPGAGGVRRRFRRLRGDGRAHGRRPVPLVGAGLRRQRLRVGRARARSTRPWPTTTTSPC